MKKILAALLAVAMLASLAACGGDSSQSSSSSSQSSSSAADDSSDSNSEDSSAAGGRFDSLQTTDEQVSLLIDFHSFTPSVSETPTEESPTVFNSSRQIWLPGWKTSPTLR